MLLRFLSNREEAEIAAARLNASVQMYYKISFFNYFSGQ